MDVYIISKTDANHGGGPTEILGVYRCSYEQAQAIVEADRREQEREQTEKWERYQPRVSLEEFVGYSEKSYSIDRFELQDLGGRSEED